MGALRWMRKPTPLGEWQRGLMAPFIFRIQETTGWVHVNKMK
jgi:hypothetical protein